MFPIQQNNSDDCDAFAMLNAFFVSRNILKPRLKSDIVSLKGYRILLGLCFFESDITSQE